MFLATNVSCFSSVFDVNVNYIVNDNFNNFRSILIFSSNSVHVHVYVLVDDNIIIIKIFNQLNF